jgi:hypothetical protein
MKSLGFLLGLASASLLHCGAVLAQSPEVFSGQVSRGVEVTSKSVFVEKGTSGKWQRTSYAIEDVTYDVKKTDSALNPLVGIVHASITGLQSVEYETESDARNSRDATPNLKWVVDLTYHPNRASKRWVFASGSTTMSWVGGDGRNFGGPRQISKQELRGPGIAEKLAASIDR